MRSISNVIVFIFAVSVYALAKKSPPSISNTVYMIRHGEKPSDGGQGLSEQGEERAQCLTDVGTVYTGSALNT